MTIRITGAPREPTLSLETHSLISGVRDSDSTYQPFHFNAADELKVAATIAFPAIQDVNLVQVSGVAITLGQKLMASSLPVVLASDQSALTVISTDLDIRNLVAATDKIDIGLWLGSAAPTVGQKTMASSVPIVVASDQSAVPVSGTVTANQGTAGTADWLVKVRGVTVTTADGLVTAPAANVLIAEVASLAAGDYEVYVHMGTDDTQLTGRYLLAVWTDSANVVKDNLSLIPAPGFGTYYTPRLTVALNDKIRILSGNVASAAATRYQGHIAVRLNA